MNISEDRIPNALIDSSSPYLRQHAYNPVKWLPWGEVALKRSVAEDKLIILSIGYSACHWCHVMEHESFEDEEVAAVMNNFFISIKVDREERPDIDQVYMEAIQILTGKGGWPLNCILLPDGRPVYGGTYFPKDAWRNLLLNLAKLYRDDKSRCINYAKEITDVLNLDKEQTDQSSAINFDLLIRHYADQFDKEHGGMDREPKFPMPAGLQFLLAYAFKKKDNIIADHVHYTLRRMALGGIYDQIGGGFARYSTDRYWKVPHFEKMLYDNAQLISLYSAAYADRKDPLYKEITEETISFFMQTMCNADGAFFSAMDADSEGVEGKYYVWNEDDLNTLTNEERQLFSDSFLIGKAGLWEQGYSIPLRYDHEQFESAPNERNKLSVLIEKIKAIRQQRTMPGIDDKIICSWNALMCAALVDAYLVFGNASWLVAAERNMYYMMQHMIHPDGFLLHISVQHKNELNVPVIHAFADDYACMMHALIRLYQATANEKYLEKAAEFARYAIDHFSDEQNNLFYYTADIGENLIARKKETQDNVIPSSNAIIAGAFKTLGILLSESEFSQRADRMIKIMHPNIQSSAPWYAYWAKLAFEEAEGMYELVITGLQAGKHYQEFGKYYQPFVLSCYSEAESTLPLMVQRFNAAHDAFYVCRNQSCLAPVYKLDDCLRLLSAET